MKPKSKSKRKKASAKQTPQFKVSLERHIINQKRQLKETHEIIKRLTTPQV